MNPYRSIVIADQSKPVKLSFVERLQRAYCRLRGKHTFSTHRFGPREFIPYPGIDWLGESKRRRYDICKICKEEIEWGMEPLPLVFTRQRTNCDVCKKNIPVYDNQPYHE